jgi:hypothetical protein
VNVLWFTVKIRVRSRLEERRMRRHYRPPAPPGSLERLASLERYEYRITTGNGFRPVADWATRTGSVLDTATRLATASPLLYADVSCRRS